MNLPNHISVHNYYCKALNAIFYLNVVLGRSKKSLVIITV